MLILSLYLYIILPSLLPLEVSNCTLHFLFLLIVIRGSAYVCSFYAAYGSQMYYDGTACKSDHPFSRHYSYILLSFSHENPSLFFATKRFYELCGHQLKIHLWSHQSLLIFSWSLKQTVHSRILKANEDVNLSPHTSPCNGEPHPSKWRLGMSVSYLTSFACPIVFWLYNICIVVDDERHGLLWCIAGNVAS